MMMMMVNPPPSARSLPFTYPSPSPFEPGRVCREVDSTVCSPRPVQWHKGWQRTLFSGVSLSKETGQSRRALGRGDGIGHGRPNVSQEITYQGLGRGGGVQAQRLIDGVVVISGLAECEVAVGYPHEKPEAWILMH